MHEVNVDMRGAFGRHVVAVLVGSLLALVAGIGIRVARKAITGELSSLPWPPLLLLWPVVALVALLFVRRASARVASGVAELRGGGIGRTKTFPIASVQSARITGVWPHLELALASGAKVSFSVLTFAPGDRDRLLRAVGAATPADMPATVARAR
jgi:hypothetical protein